MIKAIVFDWYGVFTEKWVDTWKKELRIKRKIGEFKRIYLKNMPLYARNKIDGKEFLQRIIKITNLEPPKYKYLVVETGKLNTELLRFTKKLRKKYKTCLLSDNFKEIVPVIKKKIGGFSKYFDVVCLSNVENTSKDNSKIYKIALKRLKAKPGECLFIDDRKVNIGIAKKIGFKTIVYRNNRQLKKKIHRKLKE